MRITLANESKQAIGGGFTFLRTFAKYAARAGAIAENEQEADTVLISGATMVKRDYVEDAKRAGKRIVLRIDNAPRNSRNRNTGTSRLKDFAAAADLVIYQSDWAREFLMPFVGKDGPVILNGADAEIFSPEAEPAPADGEPQCLFVQYNRDETKQWPRAWFEFQMLSRREPKAHLWIVGNFSPELQASKFDFFMGERHEYLGVRDPEDMAAIMRGAQVLYAPYWNDACSQTIIEARLCAVPDIVYDQSGGTPEIMAAPIAELTAERMTRRYLEEIARL